MASPAGGKLCQLFVGNSDARFFRLIEAATEARLLWSHDAIRGNVAGLTRRYANGVPLELTGILS